MKALFQNVFIAMEKIVVWNAVLIVSTIPVIDLTEVVLKIVGMKICVNQVFLTLKSLHQSLSTIYHLMRSDLFIVLINLYTSILFI